MDAELERRLEAAAEAVREQEVVAARCQDLKGRVGYLEAELSRRAASYKLEAKDVERLEKLSLTRVLAALRGSHADDLARERAEADAERFRLAEVRSRLDATRASLADATRRQNALAGARADYEAVLLDKAAYLSRAGGERAVRLTELTDERGRLRAELKELDEATLAATGAEQALRETLSSLDSAHGWSTYDTFFGGGMISSSVKHGHLDDAARLAADADRRLAQLRTELADVSEVGLAAGQLAVDGTTRFFDVWFDNIFTDLRVRDQIKSGQANVGHALTNVLEIKRRLAERRSQVVARTGQLAAEWTSLLRA